MSTSSSPSFLPHKYLGPALILSTTLLTTLTILSTQALLRRTRRKHLKDEVDDLTSSKGGRDIPLVGRKKSSQGIGKEKTGERWEEDGEEVEFGSEGEGEGYDEARRVPASTSTLPSISATGAKPRKPTSEHIILESLSRNYIYFGEKGMKSIRESFVIVVGLGGVGSAAAIMLARSGVGKMRLIDFDQVSLSSLNRHATATLADVGTPKVTSCKDAFARIAPWVEIDARVELFGKDSAEDLLGDKPDFVLDCIDNIDSKAELITYCKQHNIPVISSLGAGAKSDPSRIQIGDISETFEDPLARVIRRLLRQEGIFNGVPTVFSTEIPKPEIGLLPLPDDEFAKGKVDELSALANFRVRILPVLGPLPAMFGNAMAAYVLNMLGGFKMEPLPFKNRQKTIASMHKGLLNLEFRMNGTVKLLFNENDLQYFYEEIHRLRTVVAPFSILQRPAMMRWKKADGLTWDNIVIFEQSEGERHIKHCLMGDEDPEIFWGPETTAMVNDRLREEKRIKPFRLGASSGF